MEYQHREDMGTLRTPAFGKHMNAMTAENLRNKGEIAAELAARDNRITELEVRAAALAMGYAEAIEDIADWACYADEYFQQKHDLAGCLKDHRDRLAAAQERE
jgi:hypothetical protein